MDYSVSSRIRVRLHSGKVAGLFSNETGNLTVHGFTWIAFGDGVRAFVVVGPLGMPARVREACSR
jgi:hypothetical protein